MRRRKREPEPPHNVWARLVDGRVIPLDGIYTGFHDGMHVWTYWVPEPPVEMGCDLLPAKTALTIDIVVT